MQTKMITAAILGVSLAVASAAFADTTINVKLWDKGPDSATPSAHDMGMGSGGNMAMAMVGVKADKTIVAAGTVTFVVTNASKDIVHEMILSPVPADGTALPYVAADFKVKEDAASHLGEVSELEPGKAGRLTVDMKPGKYILFCNIPAHFMNGMWTEITVK